MDNIYLRDLSVEFLDIKNAIDERLAKTQSILTLLMADYHSEGFSVHHETVNLAVGDGRLLT